jgi:AraC-like DNA-binding protein
MIDTPKKVYFHSRRFFLSEFSFNLRRMRHTPKQFNETTRFQREFWKIVFIISGHGQEIINNRKYPMKAGSLFVIHPDDKTTVKIESEYIDIYNIVFMPEFIANGIRDLKSDFDFFAIFGRDFKDVSREHREMLYVLDSTKETEQLIKKMEKEYLQEKPNYRNMIKLYLQALLINISRLSSNKIRKDKKKNIAQYIEHMIEEHFHDEFNLSLLSEQVGLTKSHICRLFKELNGETIMTRLRERRLDEAKQMLKYSNLNISEICFHCGFNNLSYFYRAFTDMNGVNPGKYRKKIALH